MNDFNCNTLASKIILNMIIKSSCGRVTWKVGKCRNWQKIVFFGLWNIGRVLLTGSFRRPSATKAKIVWIPLKGFSQDKHLAQERAGINDVNIDKQNGDNRAQMNGDLLIWWRIYLIGNFPEMHLLVHIYKQVSTAHLENNASNIRLMLMYYEQVQYRLWRDDFRISSIYISYASAKSLIQDNIFVLWFYLLVKL